MSISRELLLPVACCPVRRTRCCPWGGSTLRALAAEGVRVVLAERDPGILAADRAEELDLNPVLVLPEGRVALIADVRILYGS